MNIDSIIFDLDGTLWDSTEVVLKAWDKVVKEEKEVKDPITREALQGVMGLQVKEISAKLFPYMTEEKGRSLLKACCETERELIKKEGGKLYPHLEDTIKILAKKYPLFIVSNCECGYIESFFEYHKMGKYFKGIECAGNTGLSKGENIKKIMQRNNLEKAIYVGDTQGDCDGAKCAGIPFIYARHGFGEVTHYDSVIDGIHQLIEVV